MRIIFITFFMVISLLGDTNSTEISENIRCQISKNYYKFLNSVDCYLADYDDANGSNLETISKNRLHVIFSPKDDRGSLKFSLSVRGKIALPQLQDKLELSISKQEDDRIENEQMDSESEDFLNDNNFHVALKYYAYKESYSSAYGKLSFSIHSPIGFYAKLGVEKSYFTEDYQTIFSHGLYYYLFDNEFAFSTSVSFFVPYEQNFGVEQKNRWYWEEAEKRAVLEHTLNLYQIYDLKNRFMYQAGVATVDDDECDYCLDWYGVSGKYHHQFSSWYFVEVALRLLKERANDFKFDRIITLNFGMTLSK